MITINVPKKLAHHALKLSWPLWAAGTIVPEHHQALMIKIPAYALMFLGSAFGALGWLLIEDCPLCKPRPRQRLNRPHYRLWKTYGRYGWALLGVLGVAWVVTVPFVGALEKNHGDSLPSRITIASLGALVVLYLSAKRFVGVNYDLEQPRPIKRFVVEKCTALVHKGHLLTIGAMAASWATLLIFPRTGPMSLVGGLVSLMVFPAVYLVMRHSDSLCEQCAVEFPTDAAERAARKRYRFTLLHRYGSWPMYLVLGSLVANLMLPHAGVVVMDLGTDTVLAVAMLLSRYHSQYQPWCPYCRGGGGGGDHEEVPDPTPDNGRPLPVA